MSKKILGVKSSPKASHLNEYIFGAEGFVASYDLLYCDFEKPWEQTFGFDSGDSRTFLALHYWERIFPKGEHRSSAKILEIECGFGHVTEGLRVSGLNSTGVDISRVVTEKAHAKHKEATFFQRDISDVGSLKEFDPDIINMREVTWFVLDSLNGFLENLAQFAARRVSPNWVIHLLTMHHPMCRNKVADSLLT